MAFNGHLPPPYWKIELVSSSIMAIHGNSLRLGLGLQSTRSMSESTQRLDSQLVKLDRETQAIRSSVRICF